MLNVVLSAVAAALEKACTARSRAARRGAKEPLVRSDGARHAGAVRVRLLRRADGAELLRDHALQIGVGGIDLRVDDRDRYIGAPDHAVNVGDLQLLQDVLRGVAFRTRISARGGRSLAAWLLLCPVRVLRLRDRDELDSRQRPDDVLDGSALGET